MHAFSPRRIATLMGVLAATVLGGGMAQATLVNVVFGGSVTDVPNDLSSGFNVGDSISGSFQYDTSIAANPGGDSSASSFDAITDFSFTAGSYSAGFGSPTTGSSNIQVYNDLGVGNWDHISIVPVAPTLAGPDVNGYALQFVVLRFDDTSESIFSDASVLPGAINFSDYDLHAVYFFFQPVQGGDLIGVTGDITSVRTIPDEQPVVPEPASMALVGIGLAAGLSRLRRRK